MTVRIPKGIVARKTALVAIGTAMVTGAPFVPVPWLSGLLFTLGGLLGGKALLKRPGDVKALR
jgi:predicted TIM-barrel enzyme